MILLVTKHAENSKTKKQILFVLFVIFVVYKIMKKTSKTKREPEMRKEYDFSRGIRGKYYKRFREGSNVAVIDAELAKIFPDSKSVNQALHLLVNIARKSTKGKAKQKSDACV